MKICILTDKVGTAIHEPELKKAEILKRHNITVCDVHPKRPSQEQLTRFYEAAKDADVIDYQYWKSAELVRGMFSDIKEKKSLLTHHNPYNILDVDNEQYDAVFTTNKTMAAQLQEAGVTKAHCIPHGIDIDFFAYNPDYTEEKVVNMVVNRFEGKKGVLPVAQACAELGYKLVVVGRISDPKYFEECKKYGIEFYEGISWEALRDLYYKSAIHVCNSIDNFESGTLPMLEAMACGVPILTRYIGQVPDFYNGENAVLNENSTDDVKALKNLLKEMMEDRPRRLDLIKKGLSSVRKYSNRRRAYLYNKAYYKDKWYDYDEPLVSVIISTYNDKECLLKNIAGIQKQDYPNIEIIVADDNSDKELQLENIIDEIRKLSKVSIEYVNTYHEGYGLAMARNLGAVNAYGEMLLFIDQRFEMKDETFITELVDKLEEKVVVYPAKEVHGEISQKTGFIENICLFRKKDFFMAGMFNERIDRYGGLSQEIRCRLERQGFKFVRVPSAIIVQTRSTANRAKKEMDTRISKDQLVVMGFEK